MQSTEPPFTSEPFIVERTQFKEVCTIILFDCILKINIYNDIMLLYYKVIEKHFAASAELQNIIEDCKTKGFVDNTSAQRLSKEAVNKLIELRG